MSRFCYKDNCVPDHLSHLLPLSISKAIEAGQNCCKVNLFFHKFSILMLIAWLLFCFCGISANSPLLVSTLPVGFVAVASSLTTRFYFIISSKSVMMARNSFSPFSPKSWFINPRSFLISIIILLSLVNRTFKSNVTFCEFVAYKY